MKDNNNSKQYNWTRFKRLDLSALPTPVHVLDIASLKENLRILKDVQDASGARIIFALKAFAQFSMFPIMREYLSGASASSLHEALLAHQEFGGELHLCAPAYPPEDLSQLINIADHIVCNSIYQLKLVHEAALQAGKKPSLGLRLNPEHSEVEVALYDPCAPGSRLGIRLDQLQKFESQSEFNTLKKNISGLHFHTLCEQGLAPLQRTLAIIEERFGNWIDHVQWINFGGGHHITHPDYDRMGLVQLIRNFKARHNDIEVYLEPGEAVVIHTGILISSVLDILPVSSSDPIQEEAATLILDTSATAHMPDILEMPYRPEILGAAKAGQKKYTYRLGGLTCLAGDHIGEYSFDHPLQPGDRLFFLDMSHYTMVKNTNFNGVRRPALASCDTQTGAVNLIQKFGYIDFRNRMG